MNFTFDLLTPLKFMCIFACVCMQIYQNLEKIPIQVLLVPLIQIREARPIGAIDHLSLFSMNFSTYDLKVLSIINKRKLSTYRSKIKSPPQETAYLLSYTLHPGWYERHYVASGYTKPNLTKDLQIQTLKELWERAASILHKGLPLVIFTSSSDYWKTVHFVELWESLLTYTYTLQ